MDLKTKKNVGVLRSFYSRTWSVFSKPTNFRNLKDLIKNKQYILPSDEELNFKDSLDKIDSLTKVLERILSIVRKPVFKTDSERLVKRSDLVSSLDQKGFIDTMRDISLWKEKNGEKTPEFVHTSESIDSIIMYENKFICLLVDLLSEDIDDFSLMEEDYFSSLAESYEMPSLTYSSHSFLNELPLFKGPIDREFYDIPDKRPDFTEKLGKAKKYIKFIKSSKFYKSVSPYKIKKDIIPTNVLIHNPLYSYCYKFYLDNYLNQNYPSDCMDKSYFNFIVLRLLNLLDTCGVDLDGQIFKMNKDGFIEFNPIVFVKDQMTYSLKEEADLSLIIDLDYKGERSSSIIHMIRKVDKKSLKPIRTKKKNDEKIFDNSIFITASNKSNYYNKILVSSYYKNDQTSLMNLIKSLGLVFKVKNIFEVCPVCGSRNVYNFGTKAHCLNCDSSMSYFKNEDDSFNLWIKSILRKED